MDNSALRDLCVIERHGPSRIAAEQAWSQRRRRLALVTVTLDLSEEILARLQAEATRRSLSMDALVEELAASLPSDAHPPTRRRLSFVAMGSSTSGHRASQADEMLADGFGRVGRD